MDIKIEPRKAAERGGWLMMPLPEGITEEMFAGRLCTMCALWAALW